MPEEPVKTPKVTYGYPSNTKKSKEEPEKERPVIERITSKEAVRKKTLGRRVAESFTGDDAQSVGNYILFDVMIPAAKGLLLDIINQGSERALYGDSRGRSRIGGGNGRPGYAKMYNGNSGNNTSRRDERELSRGDRQNHNFDDIVIEDRGEAEGVLDRLQDLINDYDQATVADLYTMVGITPLFTDQNWGWTDLRGCRIDRVRQGYLLVLPRTEDLKK